MLPHAVASVRVLRRQAREQIEMRSEQSEMHARKQTQPHELQPWKQLRRSAGHDGSLLHHWQRQRTSGA